MIRGTCVLHETHTTTGTESVERLIKKKSNIWRKRVAMEEPMVEKRVLALNQEQTREVKPEMNREVLAEVEGEVLKYQTRAVEEPEDLKLIATLVAATMTTGNRGAVILIGIVMKIGNMLGIPPLREGIVKGTSVTTEREIRDQVHQCVTREEMMTLSVMNDLKKEG